MARLFRRLAGPFLALGIIVLGWVVTPAGAWATGNGAVPSASGRSSPAATQSGNWHRDPTKTPPRTGPTATSSRPTSTPTATVAVRATVTSAPPTTPSGGPSAIPRVMINANLYGSLDLTKLRPGDVFKEQAVRAGAAETALPRSTFLNAVGQLARIPTRDVQRYGLVKEIVFSSVQDLQTYLADPAFPPDVAGVEYDFEGGMTPQVEYSNPVGSAGQFAKIAHAHGKVVTFTPIASLLNTLIRNGGMAQIGPQVAVVGYQGQKQYLTLGESAFLSRVQSDSAAIRRDGSRFATQLGFGWEDCPTTVRLFSESAAWLDLAAIGTHSDGTYAACVLAGLRPS
jgi:hypothetical protein